MAAVSEQAKARKRAYQRERYQWYRDHGICFRCLKAPAEPGHIYCRACHAKNVAHVKKVDPEHVYSKTHSASRRKRLKAAGLCVNCGRVPPVEGRCLCIKCRDKNRDSAVMYNLRKKMKAEGVVLK